jgi:hypothetical protein
MTWLLLLASLATTWSFDQDEIGKKPAGFRVETVHGPAIRWLVQQEGGNRYLTQAERDAHRDVVTIALPADTRMESGEIKVRLRLISGQNLAGIVFGFQDPLNHYLVRIYRYHRNLRLYRVVDGNRFAIAGEDDIDIEPQQWYTMAVKRQGSLIQVRLAGIKLFEVNDATFKGPGGVGLWIKGDTVAQFDDLSIQPLGD